MSGHRRRTPEQVEASPHGPGRPGLLGALRDAHADAVLRADLLGRCGRAMWDGALRQVTGELERLALEQERRMEHLFASLGEEAEGKAGGHAPEAEALLARLHGLLASQPRSATLDAVLLDLMWRSMRGGAGSLASLRLQAGAEGLHLAARLLDLSAVELRDAASALAALSVPSKGKAVN